MIYNSYTGPPRIILLHNHLCAVTDWNTFQWCYVFKRKGNFILNTNAKNGLPASMVAAKVILQILVNDGIRHWPVDSAWQNIYFLNKKSKNVFITFTQANA